MTQVRFELAVKQWINPSVLQRQVYRLDGKVISCTKINFKGFKYLGRKKIKMHYVKMWKNCFMNS